MIWELLLLLKNTCYDMHSVFFHQKCMLRTQYLLVCYMAMALLGLLLAYSNLRQSLTQPDLSCDYTKALQCNHSNATNA